MKIRAAIKPNSRHDESVAQQADGSYEIRTKAPATEGKANARAIELLAKHFKTPKANIKLIAGHTSRRKTFEIS